jgi:hypothetical protein
LLRHGRRINWPRNIPAPEPIIRGICSPYHVESNGKLKPEAYDPTPNTDEVSVLRVDWIGANLAKRRSAALQTDRKIYKGMAVIAAEIIRTQGAEVVDSRHVYCGHGDIKHGIKHKNSQPDPPSAELVRELRKRNKELAKLSRYHPDPDPGNPRWTGPRLESESRR